MLPEQANILIQRLTHIVRELVSQEIAPVTLERPKVAAHGDVATNIALQIAKIARQRPRDLAQKIVDRILQDKETAPLITQAEIAGPGFINFRLSDEAVQAVLGVISEQGQKYGHWPSRDQKVLVEFVSANPTGPLHVGHARQAALGDALCHLFEAGGYEVSREFYYNDAGNQINNLVDSVQARIQGVGPDDANYPADGYRGDYIADIARDYLAGKVVQASDGVAVQSDADARDTDAIRRFAVTYLRHEQDLDLKAFGLVFDRYYLESSLYADGQVQAVVDRLTENGHTYEKDGALWLKTTELGTGDDKDRVMRKGDGSYTYFVPDVAYHVTKWERDFHKAINIQGSDHHGTVARVKAGLQGLEMGIPVDYPDYVLHKMVKVVRDGQEVKISKRAGSYVTLRDLIDWVGRDAVRFFLIQRRADTEFVFDVDLARSQTEENPVYYVQYAHARICSVLLQADEAFRGQLNHANAALLTAPSEQVLLKRLAQFPDIVQQAMQDLSPHLIAFWLRDCASDFHAWYNAQRLLVDDLELKGARLRLADATRQVLVNGLTLLGVSAPQRM